MGRRTSLNHVRTMLSKLRPKVQTDAEAGESARYRARLPYPDFHPTLLLDIFREAMRMQDHRPYEKCAWAVDFLWARHPHSIRLEKFGLNIYTPFPTRDEIPPSDSRIAGRDDADLAHPITAELLRKLLNAQSIAERGLADLAQIQCDKGNVTIDNVYWGLRDQYDFLRSEAQRQYKRKPPKAKTKATKSGGTVTSWSIGRPERHGGYVAGAAIHAYFSLLEHLMIVMLPFTAFDPSSGQLTKMIDTRWGDKVAAVIDLGDPMAKALFNELKAIKDGLRNPLSHGGFGIRNTSLFFHLPGIAAMPVMMRKHKAVFRAFGRTIMEPEDFASACDVFDRFDAFLDGSKVRFGYRWARSGLAVDFSARARKEYALAMSDDETFNRFLDHRSDEYSRHANMDY